MKLNIVNITNTLRTQGEILLRVNSVRDDMDIILNAYKTNQFNTPDSIKEFLEKDEADLIEFARLYFSLVLNLGDLEYELIGDDLVKYKIKQ